MVDKMVFDPSLLFNRIDQFNLVYVSQTLPPKRTACWPPIEIRITGPWRWIRSWKANKGDFIIRNIELKILQGRKSNTIPKSSPDKKKVKKKKWKKKPGKFLLRANTFECKWRTVGCQKLFRRGKYDNFWMNIQLSKITFLGISVEEIGISYQKLTKNWKKKLTKN